MTIRNVKESDLQNIKALLHNFNISDEFFFECKKRSGNTIGYYNLHAKDSLIFNAKWRLFVYKDMEEF